MKATRDSFGEEIVRLGESHPEIVVLDADLSKSTKSIGFAKKYPERFFQMGIAEANMIGTAAGLAMSGKIPFACSFGAFITGRYDQIRMSVGYNRAPVKLVGTHAGVAIGEDGHSQMGLEDIAVLRSLPEIVILQPADHREAISQVRYAAKTPQAFYLRLTRQKMPDVHGENYEYRLGKWPVLKKGAKLALIGSGQLVHSFLEASKSLSISASVINASTLKPIDENLLHELSQDHSLFVTGEDHYTTGGLGSAVAEWMAETASSARLLRIGMSTFGESGSPEDVLKHFGLDGAGVQARIEAFLREKVN